MRAGVAAVDADCGFRHLRRCRVPQLADDLDDVRDTEHVGVRRHPAVCVVRKLAGVEVERVAFYEAATVLAAFVLLGHWFEMRARGGANDAIRTLLDLAPPKAVVLR